MGKLPGLAGAPRVAQRAEAHARALVVCFLPTTATLPNVFNSHRLSLERPFWLGRNCHGRSRLPDIATYIGVINPCRETQATRTMRHHSKPAKGGGKTANMAKNARVALSPDSPCVSPLSRHPPLPSSRAFFGSEVSSLLTAAETMSQSLFVLASSRPSAPLAVQLLRASLSLSGVQRSRRRPE